MNQTEYVGYGSINELKGILKDHNPQNIFLVTGRNSYETSGVKAKLDEILVGRNVLRFYDFAVNPKLPDIEEGIRLFKNHGSDFVIAPGGGSAIDVAKTIIALSANPGIPNDYVTGKIKIENQGVPLVAIPTTSGSGSEATHFAVVYVDGKKFSLAHKSMLPAYAIVDPTFTSSLSPELTAPPTADAFCQAVESYLSVNSTDESNDYAKEAIELAWANMVKVVTNPDPDNREAMARAAHLAGKAINISKTTASHALSYEITTKYGIPHGHAVILTLGNALRYIAEANDNDIIDPRGSKYVKNRLFELFDLLGIKNPVDAKDSIRKVMIKMGINPDFAKIGIDTPGLRREIAGEVNPERLDSFPVKITGEGLEKLLVNR